MLLTNILFFLRNNISFLFLEYTKFNYIGSSIGRHANRICKGKFSLEGKDYEVTINNNGNHNHGGVKGFDKVNNTAHIETLLI